VEVEGSNFSSQEPSGCLTTTLGGCDIPGGFLYFADLSKNDYAGRPGDELGLTIESWSATEVIFAIGSGTSGYTLGNAMAARDSGVVWVDGATYNITSLPELLVHVIPGA